MTYQFSYAPQTGSYMNTYIHPLLISTPLSFLSITGSRHKFPASVDLSLGTCNLWWALFSEMGTNRLEECPRARLAGHAPPHTIPPLLLHTIIAIASRSVAGWPPNFAKSLLNKPPCTHRLSLSFPFPRPLLRWYSARVHIQRRQEWNQHHTLSPA